jgi:hypothetical protein
MRSCSTSSYTLVRRTSFRHSSGERRQRFVEAVADALVQHIELYAGAQDILQAQQQRGLHQARLAFIAQPGQLGILVRFAHAADAACQFGVLQPAAGEQIDQGLEFVHRRPWLLEADR